MRVIVVCDKPFNVINIKRILKAMYDQVENETNAIDSVASTWNDVRNSSMCLYKDSKSRFSHKHSGNRSKCLEAFGSNFQ